MLTNALLRVEKPKGPLSPPFELVVKTANIWVLELPVPKGTEEDQLKKLAACLERKKPLVSREACKGKLVLFLQSSLQKQSPRLFGAPLVQVVADLNANLEIYECVS
jgi:hypothetical protein